MTSLPALYRDVPAWEGMRTAAIGTGSFADEETGARFLAEACVRLRGEGFGAVVGPMDGGTWGKYRLPVWTDGSPAFAMEPDAGAGDWAAYLAAGFQVAERHLSATAATGTRGWGGIVENVLIESWNGEDGGELLRSAHQLVMTGFSRTPFFTPIPQAAFIDAYRPLLARADPRFILRGRDAHGRTVGLTLAFPDPLRRGAVVLKTYVGSVPGVGRAMADRVHELAGQHGYAEVVHALMREGIVSEAQSRKFGGRVFRRYALMGRRL